jgi:superfamily I DNA/RNA helicase/mRNA-degrading endonuclease RelE of RelBE toxin-antitoxin system
MTARLSLYRKAEEELYRLDRSVKAQFYDFCHRFRANPDLPGLDLKKLKGDSRIHRAKVNASYRALMIPLPPDPDGIHHWLIIAVRHRKDVYEELQVAVNRVTGEIEFVDLAVVGDSALRRAGITLTPTEPDTPPGTDLPVDADTPIPVETTEGASGGGGHLAAERGGSEPPAPGHGQQPADPGPEPAPPLLAAHTAEQLRELGVAEPLIGLALAVATDTELDQLLDGAPALSKDILYGLAAGMSPQEIHDEITEPVRLDHTPDPDDLAAALGRTQVTSLDDDVQQVLEQGSFRAWKVYLHPKQERAATRDYPGSARVTGGPGTGKTVVALHRVRYLVERLDDGADKPILLTTFTANLAADLRARLAYLLEPEQLRRVDVTHIDQLAARVLAEGTPARHRKKRVNDQVAATEMRQLLAELDQTRWDPDFLVEEWDQVILGHSVTTRSQYFHVRRAGRGRGLTRPERSDVWKIIEQFTARLDKLGIETWGQAAERAARHETTRAHQVEERRRWQSEHPGEPDPTTDESSGRRYRDYRYRHIVVDEAQDLRAAHWKLLRAMADPATHNDLFIAADTHQRIYDHQVTLSTLGINIRGGRSQRLTLSYRTTRQILARALTIIDEKTTSYDDLDDGTDDLAGYRSILRGSEPTLTGYDTWHNELTGLAHTLTAWRQDLATSHDSAQRADPNGRIAVCVADREKVTDTINHLTAAGLTCAEITRDGVDGNGEIHVGTMHRFKGLEYERLAVIGVRDGVVPRAAINRFRTHDPSRYQREHRKARSLLFVAVTRARDTLAISWHGTPSPLLRAPAGSERGQGDSTASCP